MSEPLLELRDIEAGYGRAALVLRGLSVSVPAGTVVCLVGPNGAGKSTVLKVASGLLAPRSGTVHVDGQDVTGRSPQRMLAAGVAHVLQGHSVFPEMTVAENVGLGAYTVTDKARVAERIAFVQDLFPVVRERWRSLAGLLSGGEQQQLAIARALLTRPKLLMLDEPTEGIQPSIIDEIEDAIRRIKEELGIAVLLVEQYLDFAERLADAYVVMEKGAVVAAGVTRDLAADTVKRYLTV